MYRSYRLSRFGRFAVILLGIMFALGSMRSASALQLKQSTQGTVLLADGSLCWYVSSFFGRSVYPPVDLYSPVGTLVDSAQGTSTGRFIMTNAPIPGVSGAKLVATCEGATVEHVVTQADLDLGEVHLVLPNSRPVVSTFAGTLNGLSVRGVPPSTTIAVSVSASDPDGDVIHYQWRASGGTATNVDGPASMWTLPSSPGLHFVYALLSDGKGGYTEKQLAISSDGGIVPSHGPLDVFLPLVVGVGAPPPVSARPSDRLLANTHFLAYLGKGVLLDDRVSACAYYRDIGAVTSCAADGTPNGYGPNYTSFTAWKNYWGFGSGTSNEASAKYANLADLNLQRDMHTLSRPSQTGTTDVASYVCNYPNPANDPTLSNVRLGKNLVACVAFEYSRTVNPSTGLPYNGGLPFTKFITFGPDGKLLLSVNLDGRGEKFIPGACATCHGGVYSLGKYGVPPAIDPAFDMQFVPYDLDNYQFSTEPGFHRQDQEAQLRALNKFVLDTRPYPPAVELINGWYPTPASNFDGTFVPLAWRGAGDVDLYEAVIKPDCRMCHIGFSSSTRLGFETPADFDLWKKTTANRVCGAWSLLQDSLYSMPNAKETFDRFWTNKGSPPGMDKATVLLQWLIAHGTLDDNQDLVTTCALPTWLP